MGYNDRIEFSRGVWIHDNLTPLQDITPIEVTDENGVRLTRLRIHSISSFAGDNCDIIYETQMDGGGWIQFFAHRLTANARDKHDQIHLFLERGMRLRTVGLLTTAEVTIHFDSSDTQLIDASGLPL